MGRTTKPLRARRPAFLELTVLSRLKLCLDDARFSDGFVLSGAFSFVGILFTRIPAIALKRARTFNDIKQQLRVFYFRQADILALEHIKTTP